MQVTRNLKITVELDEEEARKLSRNLGATCRRIGEPSRSELVNDGTMDNLLSLGTAIRNELEI
jgi:hypothetical protein